MKHFLFKNKLTFRGSGGGGGGGQEPKPPIVVHYPNVLAPPVMGQTNTLASFAYAEMIDLISDGPIEGIINKNGRKLYEDQIFEGIYLNEVPIKETSENIQQKIPIDFIRDQLKIFWKTDSLTESLTLVPLEPSKRIITSQQIAVVDENFTGPITITSYHPNDSIYEFINSTTKNFDYIEFLEKSFALSPIFKEKPFLTKILIPQIKAFLPVGLFDPLEGGASQDYPITLSVNNLSNYVYFSIGSDTLNNFNYFEIPRTFLRNGFSTVAGKKTVLKTLVDTSANFYEYNFSNIEIFIWSIYNEEIGVKKIGPVLDKYFRNITIDQNKPTLFNYNLVQAEFKNGAESQTPLKFFKNVHIDTEYNKDLVGPFKITNNFCPGYYGSNPVARDLGNPVLNAVANIIQPQAGQNTSYDQRNSAMALGGVARVCSLYGDSNATDITSESSDDIRWVKNWPVEYTCQGNPIIIQCVRFNYAIFDKTSAERSEQAPVPVTHYISNDNVEQIYVTLSVNRLSDTAHIDMAGRNPTSTSPLSLVKKWEQSDDPPAGAGNYGDLLNSNKYVAKSKSYGALLAYKDGTNLRIIDGGVGTNSDNSLTIILDKLNAVTKKNDIFYSSVFEFQNIYTKPIPAVAGDKSLEELFSSSNGKYDLAKMSNGFSLSNYLVPSNLCLVMPSFTLSSNLATLRQKNCLEIIDSILKTRNADNSLYYDFGLAERESIVLDTTSTFLPSENDIAKQICAKFENPTSILVLGYQYWTIPSSDKVAKYTVATPLNKYIPWHLIFENWRYEGKTYDEGTFTFSGLEDLKTNLRTDFDSRNFPNIYKYIVYPFLLVPPNTTFSSRKYRNSRALYSLMAVGFSSNILLNTSTFFTFSVSASQNKLLTLDALENLIEENVLKTENSARFVTALPTVAGTNLIAYTSYSAASALESVLKKYENGRLLGFSNIFDFSLGTMSSIAYGATAEANSIWTSSSKATYNVGNIYLTNKSYVNVDLAEDYILKYTLFVDSQSYLTNSFASNPSPAYFKEGVKQADNVTQILNMPQTITAGTRLPATVKIQVETGYETNENINYVAPGDYYRYCFDIFGVSTESAKIDLGRQTYSSVNAKRISSDIGKYIATNVNFYNRHDNLYTFELCLIQNSNVVYESGFIKNTIDSTFFDDFNLRNIDPTNNLSRLDDTNCCVYGLQKTFSSKAGCYTNIAQAFTYYANIWKNCLLISQSHLSDSNLYYKPYIVRDQNPAQTYLSPNFSTKAYSPYAHCSYKLCVDANNYLLLKIKNYSPESFINIPITNTCCTAGSIGSELLIFFQGCISGNINRNNLVGPAGNQTGLLTGFVSPSIETLFNTGYDSLIENSYPSRNAVLACELLATKYTNWPVNIITKTDGSIDHKLLLSGSDFFPNISNVLNFNYEYLISSSIPAGKGLYNSVTNPNYFDNPINIKPSVLSPINSGIYLKDFVEFEPVNWKAKGQNNFEILLEEKADGSKTHTSTIVLSKKQLLNMAISYVNNYKKYLLNLFYLSFDKDGVFVRDRASSMFFYDIDVDRTVAMINGYNNIFNFTVADQNAWLPKFFRIFRKKIGDNYINAIYFKFPTFLQDKRVNYVKPTDITLPAKPISANPKFWLLHDKKLNKVIVISNAVSYSAYPFKNSFTLQNVEDHIDTQIDIRYLNSHIKSQWYNNQPLANWAYSYVNVANSLYVEPGGSPDGIVNSRCCLDNSILLDRFQPFGVNTLDNFFQGIEANWVSMTTSYVVTKTDGGAAFLSYYQNNNGDAAANNWGTIGTAGRESKFGVASKAGYFPEGYGIGFNYYINYSSPSASPFIKEINFRVGTYNRTLKCATWSSPSFYPDGWDDGDILILPGTRPVTAINTDGRSNFFYDAIPLAQDPTDKEIVNAALQHFSKAGLPDDVLFAEPSFSQYIRQKNWLGRIDLYYVDGATLTNLPQFEDNTFANDGGISIQLPKPRIDANGNSVRRYIKVTKLSHETLSPLIYKSVSLQKVTEIVPQFFSYPLSSIVGIKIDSRSFNQLPTRSFECKLKKILVPSNYFPLNEDGIDLRYLKESAGFAKIYDGDWDGTFKLAWTNNPAWIMMDMLINKRYGLGNYIESEQIDIWELYKISRWCDAVNENGIFIGVKDNYGGVEPRHTFNALIKERFNIFDMINQIASSFRGNVYYMNSLITFTDDRPKLPVGDFTNSDVKDGLFNYANLKKDDEFTAIDITYVDEKNNYKPSIEYVEDSEGIRKRGILKKQINAFGITSKSQARRAAKHVLYQTSKENLNVSFVTDTRALLYKPGDLIRVHDELLTTVRNYGKILSIDNIDAKHFKVVIDKVLDSGIFDSDSINLYTPMSKPKYEDMASYSEFVPISINLQIPNPGNTTATQTSNDTILGRFDISNNKPFSAPVLNLLPYQQYPDSYSFSGEFSQKTYPGAGVVYSATPDRKYNIYAFYVEGDIYGNASEYGHWQLKTGNINTNFNPLQYSGKIISLDIASDPSIKLQIPHKKYFFEYFDTGKFEDFSGINALGDFVYTGFYFNPNSNETCAKFNINQYNTPKISYQRVIENDRPNVESFRISGFTTGEYKENDNIINTYSELTLCKTSKSVLSNLDSLVSGSYYSLVTKNVCVPTFKIMSISENYINEYSIFATQYRQEKFSEIEESIISENYESTFNYLYGYAKPFNYNITSFLKAPILKPIEIFNFENKTYLSISWTIDTNEILTTDFLFFNIKIQTPSKQTANYEVTDLKFADLYNKNKNLFEYNSFVLNREEVGNYQVEVQMFYKETALFSKFSPIGRRTFSFFNY